MPDPQSPSETPHRPRRPASRRRWFFVLYLFYIAGVVWLGGKLYAWWAYDVPVTQPPNTSHVLRHAYRWMGRSKILETDITLDDGYYDVLLLGASVLEEVYPRIEHALAKRAPQKLRVFNLAESAHTTRDTAIKWRYLSEQTFDLIIIYHGINDARMNCVRPDEFRPDYSHCRWYNALEQQLAAGRISGLKLVFDQAVELISLGEPQSAELLDFGAHIQTAESFRHNLEPILHAAASPSTRVVLMTFASYLPANYTLERFKNGELDYAAGQYKLAAEVWGRPENLKRTIEIHNQVIREMSTDHPGVIFVDQDALMPKEGRYFSDPCHLSPAGRDFFVQNLMSALPPLQTAPHPDTAEAPP